MTKTIPSTANCCFITTIVGVPTRSRAKTRSGLVASILCPIVLMAFAANVALAQTTISEPDHSSATRAVRANDFLNSIGVATHMSQGADDPSQVASSVGYAGIRNIRDDENPNLVPSFISVHEQSGAKFVLVSSAPNDATLTNLLQDSLQLANNGALLALEGPNEPNNFPVTYQGQTSSMTADPFFFPVANFQKDFYSQAKADPVLRNYPVFASSEAGGSEPNNVGQQFLTIPSGAGALLPDGTKYADFANVHNYVIGNGACGTLGDNQAWNAEDPTLNSCWDGLYGEYSVTWNKHFQGYPANEVTMLPRVTTETGWFTEGNGAISETQQGDLFLDLYLDAYKRGWSHIFIYYLHDTTSQGFWGLFHTDYTPKPSATYLRNLTTILGDTSSSFAPGQVNYSVPNEPATVHDLLIQKSNGTFDLAVWDERVSGSDQVTVNLGSRQKSVTLYDPTVSAGATQRLRNISSVVLTLSNHPVIIEIPVPR
jgi:hypothetical protein